MLCFVHIVVLQSLSCVRLSAIPRTAAHQVSLSFTVSQSLVKLMSNESVMPSDHLIICCPLFLLPSIFPSIRIFSNESPLCSRWPTYWNFSFSISPSNEYSRLILFRIDGFDLLADQESSPAAQFKNINSSALSLLHGPTRFMIFQGKHKKIILTRFSPYFKSLKKAANFQTV